MGFIVLAAAIQGAVTAPTKSLWIGGQDVLRQPGDPGNLFGVPTDSIVLVENGPPGNSTLTFTLRDPQKAITLRRGQEVIYHNHVTDRPYFRGFLHTWSIAPFGLGRIFTVRCVGVEIVLDWMIVPSLTIPAGTKAYTAIQAAVAVATGIGVPLRAFAGGSQQGTQAGPIGNLGPTGGLSIIEDVVITNPVTLREAIRAILALAPDFALAGSWDPAATYGVATIDAYLGLRVYSSRSTPGGYADLTVTDTFAGPLVAEGLAHTLDVIDAPAGVYVAGGSAAGTGLLPAGDGLPGPIRVISDSSIVTNSQRVAAAAAYMGDRGISERGSLSLKDDAISDDVHPGSALVLTDAETGATGTYRISSIERRFTGLRETWRVAYGRLPASLPRAVAYLFRRIPS